MSVLLVFPKADNNTADFGFYNATHPPLSICYLSAYLKKNDIKVFSLDLNYSDLKEMNETINSEKIQIIGFSITTFTFENAYELAKEIKKKNPYIKIIFGGMPVQLFKDRLLEGVIDSLIIGEGEETLCKVVKYYLYDSGKLLDIPNIITLKQGKIIETMRGIYLEKLDDLPFPDRECFDLTQYAKVGNTQQCYITTSRGCPYGCIYCLSGTLGHKVRLRSVESVIDEIRSIKARFPFYNKFHFIDETLNISNIRLKDLCYALKKENIVWSCMLRADDHLDNNSLELMKESGLDLFEIGIESASQYVLDSINKGIKIQKVERILQKSAELKIPVIGTIMIPHYADTSETIEETVGFIKDATEKYSLIPFPVRTNIHPKSEYSKYKKEHNIVVTHLNEIISTDNVLAKTIDQALQTLKTFQIKGIVKNISHFAMVENILPESMRGGNLSAIISKSPEIRELIERKIREQLILS